MADLPASVVLRHVRQLVEDGQGGPTDADLLRRFCDGQDEAAFAALVRRHGPMALGVCRSVLGHAEDALDACQAVFLVLARKANSIRSRPSLAAWLHGVARRLALRARSRAARRATPAPLEADPEQPAAMDALTWGELKEALHDEIGHLPERLREPLVLCYLEGRTQDEAARELGCRLTTLKGRLARARRHLRARLARRGLAPSVPLLTVALAQEAGALPAGFADGVGRSAVAFAAGAASAAGPAAELAEGTVRALATARVKLLTALALTLALLGGGAALVGASWPADETPPPQPRGGAVIGSGAQPPAPPAAPRLDPHGDPLPPGAVARLGTVRFRHGTDIEAVAFSRDGKLVASGGWDGAVCVWDAATGKRLRRLKVSVHGIHSIAFSADAKEVAVLAMRQQWVYAPPHVSVWDVTTGQKRRDVAHPTASAGSVAFAADGRSLLSAAWVGTAITLYEADTGKELHRLKGHDERVLGFAFSADGKAVASVGADQTLRLWDVATRREVRRVFLRELPARGTQRAGVSFSPDGGRVALSFADHDLRVYDSATGREVWRADGQHRVAAPAFSPDGRTVAGGLRDHTIRLWDAATGKEIRPPAGHQLPVTAVAVAPDGRTVASTGEDNTVRVWDTRTGEEKHRHEQAGRVSCLAFTPDGAGLAWGGSEGDAAVRLADVRTGKEVRRFPAPRSALTADLISVARLTFTPDGKLLAGATGAWTVHVWETATPKHVRMLRGGSQPIHYAAFSADGKRLSVGDREALVRQWDVTTGKEIFTLRGKPGSEILSAALSPDGSLVVGDIGGAGLSVLDVATGKTRRAPEVPVPFEGVYGRFTGLPLAFSPDGKTLVCPGPLEESQGARGYEVATGRLRYGFDGHQGAVRALAFSADGRFLATGSADCTVLVWEVAGRAP